MRAAAGMTIDGVDDMAENQNTRHHAEGRAAGAAPRSRLSLLAGAVVVVLLLVGMVALLASGGDTADTAEEPAVTRQEVPAGPATIAVDSALLESPNGAVLQAGGVAPDFSYTLTDGTTHRLSDLRGQKVLVNFWATWCPPCRAEMPDMQQAFAQNQSEGFAVLAVNSGETLAEVEAFSDEFALGFPLIVNESNDIGAGYAARNLPTSYFINTDGTIHTVQRGLMTTEFIEQRLEEMQ
jgi:peroxiredoxin